MCEQRLLLFTDVFYLKLTGFFFVEYIDVLLIDNSNCNKFDWIDTSAFQLPCTNQLVQIKIKITHFSYICNIYMGSNPNGQHGTKFLQINSTKLYIFIYKNTRQKIYTRSNICSWDVVLVRYKLHFIITKCKSIRLITLGEKQIRNEYIHKKSRSGKFWMTIVYY